MDDIIYKQESYLINGAIYEVYKELGAGFLEAVYQECLLKEFQKSGIPFASQPELEIKYKGDTISQKYRPDFICFGKITLEIKAVKELSPQHKAQMFNYLKITKHKLGLLVNFGSQPKVEIERVLL